LVEAGYLVPVDEHSIEQSVKKPETKKKLGSYYRFADKVLDYPIAVKNSKTCTVNGVISSFRNHDVWHPSALGRSGLLVYEKLLKYSPLPQSMEQLIQATGKTEVYLFRALKKLEQNKLARMEERGWVALKVDLCCLDKLAERLGTLGIANRRKETNLKERQQYAYSQIIRHGDKDIKATRSKPFSSASL
jgi:predicted transcriptional regulator